MSYMMTCQPVARCRCRNPRGPTCSAHVLHFLHVNVYPWNHTTSHALPTWYIYCTIRYVHNDNNWKFSINNTTTWLIGLTQSRTHRPHQAGLEIPRIPRTEFSFSNLLFGLVLVSSWRWLTGRHFKSWSWCPGGWYSSSWTWDRSIELWNWCHKT